MFADTQVREHPLQLIPSQVDTSPVQNGIASSGPKTRIVTGPLRFDLTALPSTRLQNEPGQTMDETCLLEWARKGHQAALEQIFDLYAPVLFGYVVRMCHDAAEADQIVGDVFAQLLEHLSGGRGPRTNLRAYLYQSTYHLLIDHLRESSHVSAIEAALHVPDSAPSVAEYTEEHELLRALADAVQHRLTAEQRHVILLRFVEDFSLEETARIIGKTVSAVSVLQGRAISKLRQVLKAPAPKAPRVGQPAGEPERCLRTDIAMQRG